MDGKAQHKSNVHTGGEVFPKADRKDSILKHREEVFSICGGTELCTKHAQVQRHCVYKRIVAVNAEATRAFKEMNAASDTHSLVAMSGMKICR